MTIDYNQSEIEKWINRLADENNAVVAVAILSDMGEKALDAVLEAFSNPVNRNMVENAGSVLVRIGKPAVKPLLQMLGKEEGRLPVASTLGYICDHDAVEPLIDMLKSKNKWFRWTVVRSLTILKDKRAIEPLIQRLRDRSSTVRFAVIVGLGEMGDSRALPALEKLRSDKSPRIQMAAAEAIAEIEKREADGACA